MRSTAPPGPRLAQEPRRRCLERKDLDLGLGQCRRRERWPHACVTTLVDPMSVTRDAATVGTAVDASSPGRPGDDPCAAVRYAEEYLASSAEDESRRRRFLGHALPLRGVIAGGLVLGIGYGHWAGGALNAGIGIVVVELKMLTQPTGSVRALERYRTGILGSDGPKFGWQLSPVVTLEGGGLSLTMVY